MKLDLSAAWDGAMKLITANREVLIVLVGVFFFLPSLGASFVIPSFEEMGIVPGESDQDLVNEAVLGLLRDYWWAFLILLVIQMTGTVAVMSVLGDDSRPTVGEAIKRGVMLVPTMILAQFIGAFVISAVFILAVAVGALGGPGLAAAIGFLVLPLCFYIGVKFSLSSPTIAVEQQRNPIAALARSWRLTKSNSMRLFFFYFLLIVAFFVLSIVISLISGLLFALLGESGELLGEAIFSGLINAIFALVAYAVLVSVHRQLSQGRAAVSVPNTHVEGE